MAVGPRPWAIRLFATAFILQAALTFVWALFNRDAVATTVLARGDVALTDEWVIVLTSARLSIALIPVSLVWFLASSFARWMAVLLAVFKLINMPATVEVILHGDASIIYLITILGGQVLALFAAAMLFTRQSRQWFDRKGRPYAEHFD